MRAKLNLLALVVCSLTILIAYRLPVVSEQTRYSMELTFRALVAVILAGATWRINKYIAGFLVFALFSQFYPMFDSLSARGFNNLLYGILIYYIIVSHGEDWVDRLMDMICVVALINMALVIMQTSGYDPLWHNSGTWIVGFMENPNSQSAFLALCFPAFLRSRWKWFIPLIVFGLFQATSTGGVVAVAAGFAFYCLAKDRRPLYLIGIGLIIALTVAVFIIYFDGYGSLRIRQNVWTHALVVLKDNWLVGCGIGRWPAEFVALVLYRGFPEGFVRLHSTILQTTVEMGIGFIIILTAYLINIIRRSWGDLARLAIPLTAVIIILTNGSVNFLIRIAPNAALVVVWLAIVEIELRHAKFNKQTTGP